ncbi:hypothetical protein LZ30DRAFT_785439 [Colletotrichum cereale]|nr:hypothetical protein LZ30DRAFT_785439 [Colletotrichum cereale]
MKDRQRVLAVYQLGCGLVCSLSIRVHHSAKIDSLAWNEDHGSNKRMSSRASAGSDCFQHLTDISYTSVEGSKRYHEILHLLLGVAILASWNITGNINSLLHAHDSAKRQTLRSILAAIDAAALGRHRQD